MKIVTVIGARPQFIKAASLSREFAKHTQIQELIIHTGQHFDDNMSDVFFREMEIPFPTYRLTINNLSHGAMTGLMLKEIEEILIKEKPDYVLVYGDTNTTLAGALAAVKLHIKVIHVEAGLRSFNTSMPEEINRIITDRISKLLFYPTTQAYKNLLAEGFDKIDCKMVNSGDVMQVASIYYSQKSKSTIINDLALQRYVLATIHRAENTDNIYRLTNIIDAFNEISFIINVLVPIHPRTRKIIKEKAIYTNFTMIDPVGYFDMLELIKNSTLIITDSGGLQKESYFFKKYCITIREETEWTELVEGGYNKLAGYDKNKILQYYKELESKKFISDHDLYGDGNACKIICDVLLS